jgi:hypothetical protein
MPPGPRPPADPAALDPLGTSLPARSLLFRVHPGYFSATGFNSGYGAGGRFHFLQNRAGATVPSFYAAESENAAIAETIFHDVPVRPAGLRVVSFSRKLRDRALSAVRTRREIELVQLHDLGLDRLGLRASEITDTDPSGYPTSRLWAQALHRCGAAGGLVWMSRRFNSYRAWTLFGDRVSSEDLEAASRPLPLWHGSGLDLVYELAESAGITVAHD